MTDTLPDIAFPLSENQYALLQDIDQGNEPGKTWASSHLITRATKQGLIAWNSERGTHLTELGQVIWDVAQKHSFVWATKTLGRSPIAGGGTLHGTILRCRCGWKTENNETPHKGGRAQAKRAYRRHIDEILREKLG